MPPPRINHPGLVVMLVGNIGCGVAEDGADNAGGSGFIADQGGGDRVAEPMRRNGFAKGGLGPLADRNMKRALGEIGPVARDPKGLGWKKGRFSRYGQKNRPVVFNIAGQMGQEVFGEGNFHRALGLHLGGFKGKIDPVTVDQKIGTNRERVEIF